MRVWTKSDKKMNIFGNDATAVTNKNSGEDAKVTHPTRLTVPDVTDTLLREMVSKIVKHFHPDKIILFGSRTWGALTRANDVDILVVIYISRVHPFAKHQRFQGLQDPDSCQWILLCEHQMK